MGVFAGADEEQEEEQAYKEASKEAEKGGQLKLPFQFGDKVWLAVNGEFYGVIVGYSVRPGAVVWHVTWNNLSDGTHFDFELTREKPIDGVIQE